MGSDAEPKGPQYIPGPKPVSAGDNIRSAVSGVKSVAPDIYGLNELFGKKYANLGYDIQADVGPKQAQLDFDIANKMSSQWLDLVLGSIKTADPTGFELSEQVKRAALDDVRRGGALSPAEEDAARRRVSADLKRRGRGEGIADAFTSAQYLTGLEGGRRADGLMRALGIFQGTGTERNLGISSVKGGNLPGVDNMLFDTPSAASVMADNRSADNATQNWFSNWNNGRMNEYEAKLQASRAPSKWEGLVSALLSGGAAAAGGLSPGGKDAAVLGYNWGRNAGSGLGSFF